MPSMPYLLAQRDVSDGTTPLDVVLVVSEPGEMHILSRVVVTNLTTAYTSLQLMIGNPGSEQEIHWINAPGATAREVYDGAKIPVPPGMHLIARLIGLTSGDIYTISAIGVLVAAGELTEAVIIVRGN